MVRPRPITVRINIKPPAAKKGMGKESSSFQYFFLKKTADTSSEHYSQFIFNWKQKLMVAFQAIEGYA